MNPTDETSLSPMDDIPEAHRDSVIATEKSVRPGWVWMAGGIGAVALVAGAGFAVLQTNLAGQSRAFVPLEPLISRSSTLVLSPSDPRNPTTDTDAATSEETSFGNRLVSSQQTLLGHRAYEEASEEDLVPLTADDSIRLQTAAAESFQAMADAAYKDGIILVPLSGYRSLEEQEYLFFDVKADRGQTAITRAEVSAPPGYSEHHTGYAIDIGDGDDPSADVNETFADTPAFEWLEENAARFGFELSFLPGNEQGVNFEPWHWRFVGDRESLETFYQK